jgi:dTDP-4-amino-4,6-dideoxygalactose transaminase
MAKKARLLINFGIPGPDEIATLGINAKMNEFQAAMGLCVLNDIQDIIEKRHVVYNRYLEAFIDNNKLTLQQIAPHSTQNYSYFPVLFESEKILLRIKQSLNQAEIFPRRYFYPSLDTLHFIHPKQKMPISRNLSSRILCLPLYEDLAEEIQDQIIKIILMYC